MISNYLNSIHEYLKSKLGWVEDGKYWILKSVLFCVIISFVFTFPTFYSSFFSCIPNQLDEGKLHLLKQIESPFDINIFKNVPVETHHSKRVFRLTVPLMAKTLHLNIAGIYVLQLILGILGLAIFLILIQRFLKDRFLSFLTLLCFTSIFAGKIWYLQYAVLFDGISITLLLLSCFTRISALSILFSLMAFFNDERSLVGILPILMIKFFTSNKKERQLGYSILVSVALYFGLRYFLQIYFHMRTPTGFDAGVGLGVLKVNLWGVQYKWLKCFEGFWMIIGFAGYLLWKTNRNYFLAFVLVLFAILVSSILIYDVDRSLTYGMGIIIFAIMVLCQNLNQEKIGEWIILALIISFLIPTNSFIGNFYGSCDSNFIGVEIIRIFEKFNCRL